MAEPQGSDKRSIQNVLINRPMQREFTLVMLGIMMTAAVTVGIVINFTLNAIVEGVPPTISRTTLERMIFDANSQLVVTSILIIFIAVIATGFFGVFFLHRIAGPVYRFRQVLKRMGTGEIPQEVQLRKRDFFKETAEELNKVIVLLKDVDNTSQKIDSIITHIPEDKLTPDVRAKIQEIHSTLGQLRKPSK
ncbi:MAG: hypothetical protein HY351_02990 [Candidatus Omnitrophica bacterium]|nr:hypothetical protein [Candidatus Omnitrophota bacterium]